MMTKAVAPPRMVSKAQAVDAKGSAALLSLLLMLSRTPHAALAAGQLQPGLALYSQACSKLVGAQRIESFSSARASGPEGEQVVGRNLPSGGEAICNCACWSAAEFAYCSNTAKTTVGVATFAVDESLGRWETRGLRYFRAGSPGFLAGRSSTSFVADGVLPKGPGGPVIFCMRTQVEQAVCVCTRARVHARKGACLMTESYLPVQCQTRPTSVIRTV